MSTGIKPFNWVDYIVFAQEITGEHKLVSEEACYRIAISRSYYGAYCLARNFAVNVDGIKVPKGSGAHKAVQNHFRNDEDSIKKQISRNLYRLRKDRNDADYQDLCDGLDAKALKSIKRAESIKDKLQDLKSSI